MKKIFGLVGTPQSGKTKINHIFPEYGIEFINLNTAAATPCGHWVHLRGRSLMN
jgi:dephospho-CoA kinase